MSVNRPVSALILLSAFAGVQSCITDNPAAYSGILGPERESIDAPGDGGDTGEAGGHAAGAPASAGGAPGSAGELGAGATGATGGSSTGEGGAAATGSGASAGGDGSGEGGVPSAGAGGTSGTGGSGGTVVNPPTHPDFSPACFLQTTTTGAEIMKGVPCSPDDPQLCYRPCGPNQVGWKTETCVASVYAEGDCTFPDDQTYECYAIPDPIDLALCGLTAPPAATDECGAPECYSCNFEGFYKDTGSDLKEGYCVCRPPGVDGVRRWTCGSATAWPCPLHEGC